MTNLTDTSILVIEDEPDLRAGLQHNLELEGFRVTTAADGREGLRKAREGQAALILLDLMLPGMPGLEVLRHLRETGRETPVIIISAKGQDRDKVQGLELGADDYLTKPFGISELLARLRVALRNSGSKAATSDQGVFTTGELQVDRDRHEVSVRGAPVRLTPLEYRLLHTLVRHAGKVVTRRQLLREVWGEAHLDEAHYLRVYMSALRRKIELDPARPKLLLTEQNVGYRLACD
jgi:two-component system KDP operon response regulator KdpE